MPQLKQYVLLEHMHPNMANFYVRINKHQRMKIDKLEEWRPFLQTSFIDKDGKSKTIRYKAMSDSPYQDEQIKNGILANEKFTLQEYKDLNFYNGVLTTMRPNVQKYLELYPGMVGFEGQSNDVMRPVYKLLNKSEEAANANNDFKLRLKVGIMIDGLDLEGAQNILLRLKGSSYQLPDNILDAQNALIEEMNDREEDGLMEMLKGTIRDDEQAKILLGKLKNKGLIEFDFINGQVIKVKGERKIVIKNISADNEGEQIRLFVQYLTSDAGNALYNDLKSDLDGVTAKPRVEAENSFAVNMDNAITQMGIEQLQSNGNGNGHVEGKKTVAKSQYKKKKKKPRYARKPQLTNENTQP